MLSFFNLGSGQTSQRHLNNVKCVHDDPVPAGVGNRIRARHAASLFSASSTLTPRGEHTKDINSSISFRVFSGNLNAPGRGGLLVENPADGSSQSGLELNHAIRKMPARLHRAGAWRALPNL